MMMLQTTIWWWLYMVYIKVGEIVGKKESLGFWKLNAIEWRRRLCILLENLT